MGESSNSIQFKDDLDRATRAVAAQPDDRPTIDCAAVQVHNRLIVERYVPPDVKRFLVFFQCSERRPFSKSPSHGPIKRAIRLATGYDPRKDFERCPVHVVVMEGKIGPVPYELEETYPAVAGRIGVKGVSLERYAHALPVLAERVARYISVHGKHYERMAAFTEGRYGEVMVCAQEIAGVKFPVFPDARGVKVADQGKLGVGPPRSYWAKYWIQLFLEVAKWLEPVERDRAYARLERTAIRYE